MTVTDTSTADEKTPPPPPPATLSFEGVHGRNPLADAGFGAMCRRLPSVLGHTARMAWAVDRTGVVLLLACQLLTGIAAAVVLACTAQAMTHILGSGSVPERLHGALPALVVVTTAAAVGRISSALSSYADGRITPLLTTEADIALVAAVCRVETSAYGEDGFADRQEAAEVGVTRTRLMVQDAQRFMSALIRMIAASGVITALHPLMLPLLLLAVLPAGAGAVLSARVDYETHYLNVGDRNVRSMMRWWATYSRFGDEVRANGMTGYLVYWYRALSDRIDQRTLTAAPRLLRIALTTSALGGVFLLCTWAALAWLAAGGRVALPVAATAVVAVQTTLAALGQFVIHGAAMFHTSLYLADMRAFLDLAAERAPQRGESTIPERVDEIRLDEVVYRYPGKEEPAVSGVSLTLRRGEILAIVGENGSGKSTLAKLITGILLADKGRVLWDGVDLAHADPDAVWKRTALVPQNFACWPLRARENITLGQPKTFDDGPVWDVVDAVGMREAIEKLPRQLDTLLAKELWGGAELSGGQWQRLVCGRALYRRTPLLILDEPTSQMDARGEHAIFLEIKRIAAERMTIVVTHQLENTRLADRILVMDEGRVIEQGRYEDLVAAGGLFAELVALAKDR
ncbi:ATP-binding cassette domain-containing protein [Streptomyces lomondensis]|uniref:ABC transporter n=1 Tax=Streptomyces lomondensis TaxID=68229 RepID=A0ABQ2X5V5_9ACTN|nr:ATP-binding cassette domain-containing protein [Streptomyces lomondensis]MCF0078178.1 ATP-binding cassette domain-containing protein [Streptomyces lomondensis]GGX00982.1 ABC transporter [Streptomyces lomondensis]